MTQKEAVLEYIKRFGAITPFEAFQDLGITKLATVVSRMIRDDGVAIRKTPMTTRNRYGHTVNFMSYSLEARR